MALLARDGERLQRAGPIRLAALQIEQRVDRPGELGVERDGALGKVARGLRLALALRLEEKAAQAQLLGVGRGQHRFEDAPRRRAVAGELGGLRAQQVRQRLVGERLARLQRGAHGGGPVAGAERDHAARERVEPELLPALGQVAADGRRAVPDVAQDRPGGERRRRSAATSRTMARKTLVSI